MKRKKLSDKQKNIVLIVAAVLALSSLVLFFLFKDDGQMAVEVSPTPKPDRTPSCITQAVDDTSSPSETNINPGNTDTPTPAKTEVVIVPGTNAPIYIGVSSQIDVEANNNDHVATLIKEKLLEKDFLRVNSGSLDSEVSKIEAFEVNWIESLVQIRIRTSAESKLAEDLYKEFLNLVYDNGARKYSSDGATAASPTPAGNNEAYAYLTINIYLIEE
jgi:hypothetical protein